MKKEIPLIIGAIFSVSILLMFAFLTNPHNMAFAVTATDFTIDTSNNEVFYMESLDQYIVLPRLSSAGNNVTMTVLEADGTGIDNPTTFTIFPQSKGCNISTDINQNNPCNANTGSAICNPTPSSLSTEDCANLTSATGIFGGLWCGLTDCFVLFERTSGSSHQLLRIQMTTASGANQYDVGGYMNITASRDLHLYQWGYDESNVGIGGITLFHVAEDSGSALGELYRVGGTLLMGITDNTALSMFTEDGSAVGGAHGMSDLTGCRLCGNDESITRIAIVARIDSSQASSRNVYIANPEGTLINAETPNSTTSDCSGTGVTGANEFTGTIGYLGNTEDKFLFTSDTGFWTYDVASGTITCHAYGGEISNYVRHIDKDVADNFLYVSHGSEDTLQSLTRYNLTIPANGIALDTLTFEDINEDTITGWVSGIDLYHNMAVASSKDTLLIADTTSKMRMLFLEEFGAEEPTNGGAGVVNGVCANVDVNGDGKVNVLDCIGETSVWTGFTGGQNATTIVASITDGTGLTDCGTTNPDHETCGSGLFLFAFLLLLLESLSLGLYLGFTKKTNAEPHLVDVSLIMLMIGFVALAIGFYLDWIPDVVFYGIVVLIAGLLAFGIIKHVRG